RVQDVSDAIEFCFQQGWTDGLPVVPPTPERVSAMLEAARLDPKHQIAFITHRSVSVTAEKVAVNAVMAGCKSEYMPVVVAAVEGIGDPAWSYHGPGTSTGGAAVLMIVNGPIAKELEINAGDNLFGPGWRANLTIGRALRLVMRNVCGSLPGLLDRGTLGHPGKVSYVIAENEADSPWAPLHVERGFRPEQSTVTVMAAESPHQFYNQLSNTPEGVLTTLADAMRLGGSAGRQPFLTGRHQGGQTMMELLDPTAEVTTRAIAYVDRPATLEGKRVGLIDNTKFNSDRLLEKIGAILKSEYGVAETRMFRKHNAS